MYTEFTHDALIKTPVLHIPLGQPVRNHDGRLGLRMKKSGESEYEVVWIDQIMASVDRACRIQKR